MSMPQANVAWSWDPVRQAQYYWSQTEQAYVYQDGTRVWVATGSDSFPASMPHPGSERSPRFVPVRTSSLDGALMSGPDSTPGSQTAGSGQSRNTSTSTSYDGAANAPAHYASINPAAASPSPSFQNYRYSYANNSRQSTVPTAQPHPSHTSPNGLAHSFSNLVWQRPQSFEQGAGQTAAAPASLANHPLSAQRQLVPNAQYNPTGFVESSQQPQQPEQPRSWRWILANDTHTRNQLSPDYVVRRPGSTFFTIGKVFKTLWSEPMGNSNPGMQTTASGTLRFADESFALKIRWFVVAGQGQNYCLCIPITTYRGRGVAKRGVTKRFHSIAYTGRVEPQPQWDEQPGPQEYGMMGSIRVRPRARGLTLLPMSRLNFGKIYTVEHSVKAYDFGHVYEEHIPRLIEQWHCVLRETVTLSGQPPTQYGRPTQRATVSAQPAAVGSIAYGSAFQSTNPAYYHSTAHGGHVYQQPDTQEVPGRTVGNCSTNQTLDSDEGNGDSDGNSEKDGENNSDQI